jgi:hypothetical protein
MESGEYYKDVGTKGYPGRPRLILGFVLDGMRVEIYKSQGTYSVFNMKTEKHLICLGAEHAHYIFEQCVRTLATEASA